MYEIPGSSVIQDLYRPSWSSLYLVLYLVLQSGTYQTSFRPTHRTGCKDRFECQLHFYSFLMKGSLLHLYNLNKTLHKNTSTNPVNKLNFYVSIRSRMNSQWLLVTKLENLQLWGMHNMNLRWWSESNFNKFPGAPQRIDFRNDVQVAASEDRVFWTVKRCSL